MIYDTFVAALLPSLIEQVYQDNMGLPAHLPIFFTQTLPVTFSLLYLSFKTPYAKEVVGHQ